MDLIISSATHRSGSTLLQRIFNARKETLIWGEHFGCVTDFWRIRKNVLQFSEISKGQRESYFGNGEDPNHWIPNMTPSEEYVESAIEESIKAFFGTLYSQNSTTHDLIGFKEVRYAKRELKLLRECYPELKFVLLIRDPRTTWKSHPQRVRDQWYKGSTQSFIDNWKDNAEYYLELNENDPNSYLIRYEDLLVKDKSTMELISTLGKVSVEQIEKVLSKKLGGTSNTESVENEVTLKDNKLIEKECMNIMMSLGYMD